MVGPQSKRDWLYLVFFVVHVPIMLGSTFMLFPFGGLILGRGFLVDSYHILTSLHRAFFSFPKVISIHYLYLDPWRASLWTLSYPGLAFIRLYFSKVISVHWVFLTLPDPFQSMHSLAILTLSCFSDLVVTCQMAGRSFRSAVQLSIPYDSSLVMRLYFNWFAGGIYTH